MIAIVSTCLFLFLIIIGIYLFFYKGSNKYFFAGMNLILFFVVFCISPFYFHEGKLRWWLFGLGISLLFICLLQSIIKGKFKRFLEVIGDLLSGLLGIL
ncbi:MAG: hypothetical protein M1486_01945 [Gammaproteobacteria bacterium]|nr:hypothetical protein [Gammaproteobacteria bacterium]